METIEKRLCVITQLIVSYFYDNGLRSSCLAQSYLLYKVLHELTVQHDGMLHPTLVKGYIVNHSEKVYYGHFWVELQGTVYDIATETYLLEYPFYLHNEIRTNLRMLMKTIPNDLSQEYTNIDDPSFEILRQQSYLKCLENKMLEDVREHVPLEIYNKIKYIHDKLIHL